MTENDKIQKFAASYFASSITVTAIAILFKIVGLENISWFWTLSLLWIPYGILVGSIVVVSLLFYVGFLFGFAESILKMILNRNN